MHDAVIVSTPRTSIGTAFKGSLVDVDAFELRRGGGIGVAAMCAGGGMSTALALDVPPPATGGRL